MTTALGAPKDTRKRIFFLNDKITSYRTLLKPYMERNIFIQY